MLTKAEAIRRHRLMWNWIAQTSIQEQRCVKKEEAFKHFNWPSDIKSNCWCCEYDSIHSIGICSDCPIQWSDIYPSRCFAFRSPYRMYNRAFAKDNYIMAAKYAYIIAELSENRYAY